MLSQTAAHLISAIAVVALTATALVTDIRARRIPNKLTVSAFGAAVLFHLCTRGWAGLQFAAGGFLLGFGTLFVLWLIGGGGAGDVKLMGALGAWLGWQRTLHVLIASTALVAVGGLVILLGEWFLRGWVALRKRHMSRFKQRSGRKGQEHEKAIAKWRSRRRIMPYALPVGVATWLMLAWEFVRVGL